MRAALLTLTTWVLFNFWHDTGFWYELSNLLTDLFLALVARYFFVNHGRHRLFEVFCLVYCLRIYWNCLDSVVDFGGWVYAAGNNALFSVLPVATVARAVRQSRSQRNAD